MALLKQVQLLIPKKTSYPALPNSLTETWCGMTPSDVVLLSHAQRLYLVIGVKW